MSNHARAGHESAHNLAYWRNQAYLGIGPSASGLEPAPAGSPPGQVGQRRTNAPMARWLDEGRGPVEAVTGHDLLVEGVLTRLRLREGVDLDELSAVSGLDARAELAAPLAEVVAAGLAELVGERWLRPTTAGFTVLDQLAAPFV